VRLLSERGLRVVVSFTPTRLNWHHGPRVVALAAELGASAANMSEYVPAGRGSLELALSPDDLRAVLAQWIGLREEYRGRIDVLWHDCRVGMLVSDEERRKYVGCGAGRLVARILPDGTVTPCVFLPTPIGSFRTTPFSEMWASSPLLRQFRERQGHIQGNCGACEHLDTCGGCRAVAYAYNGDPCAGDRTAGSPATHRRSSSSSRGARPCPSEPETPPMTTAIEARIEMDTVLVPTRCVLREQVGQYLVYNARTDEMHLVGRTGYHAYCLCDGSRTVHEVADALGADVAGGAPGELGERTREFLEALVARGILEMGDA
jgi:radical SAM protein with 4Fe4S-binding SPASM domain